jgi:hypothetical protein
MNILSEKFGLQNSTDFKLLNRIFVNSINNIDFFKSSCTCSSEA